MSAWMRPFLLILILLVVWDLAIRVFRIPPYLIPAPEAVVRQLFVEWPRLWRESLVTTYATLGGFAIGFASGLLGGALPTTQSQYLPSILFAAVILVLLVRPNGLFARRRESLERV